MIRFVFVPIHSEGWPFIGIAGIIAFIFTLINTSLGWVGMILTAWCAYFFRDPKRVTPNREGLVISPADGIISSIEQVLPPQELDMGSDSRWRISIFMNVFDVHVNRIPISGTIKKIWYFPGRFMNASLDKASEYNERQAFCLEMQDGRDIAFVQIAGLIARRIVSFVKEGYSLNSGDRFGIIRFGSRVDVYLPIGIEPLVDVGQRMLAGETVLADTINKEKRRIGTLI
jgi:phosphatidylserine decarboxylase